MLIPGITASKIQAGAPAPAYAPDAVVFDGNFDYLKRTSQLTGISDGSQGTISFWIHLNVSSLTDRLLYMLNENTQQTMAIHMSGGKFRVVLKQSDGTSLKVSIGDTALTTNTWHHVLASWDLSTTSKLDVYIDDVSHAMTATTNLTGTIDYTAANVGIGANTAGGSKTDCDVADFYFNSTTYLDLSVESNRRKFITSDKKPVDLGSDGSTPSGTAPVIYFTGNAATWNAGTNSGSGGNFTMNGNVSESINEPVEV